jgi:SAM-dependent methyltransferase
MIRLRLFRNCKFNQLTMELIPCIFGHGYSDDVVIQENGFEGRRCPVCGIIYISPRPEPADVFDLYHHDKAFLPSSHHISFNPGAELAARTHFSWISDKRHFQSFDRQMQPSILEIGCGGGHLLKVAKEKGWDAFGVELNPYQAKHVQDSIKIPCETNPFSRDSFGSKMFDVIFHCDVTSHLSDPIGDFSAMCDKLTPNGRLIFETGNGADIDRRYYKYFHAWQYPDHLFFFGESSIRELLMRSGFHNWHIESWSILPQLVLNRLARTRKKPQSFGVDRTSGTGKFSAPDWKQRVKRNMAAHATHFIRFSIGALSSNPKVPRTMLISASK